MALVTTKPFIDSVTFTINRADLTEKQVGEKLTTPSRSVPFSNGLRWWIDYYPAGWKTGYEKHLSLKVACNKIVTGKCNIDIRGILLRNGISRQGHFKEDTVRGYPNFASHSALRGLFVDGQLSITCSIEIDVPVIKFQAPRLYQKCDHVPTDFVLKVGSEQIPVHKNLLSLLSPVFHAMVTHDTAEARNGEVTIKDFEYDSVKLAIDFCYGKKFEKMTAEMILPILRFADKYDIRAVTKSLENVPKIQLSKETVCAIALYAYELSKDDLLAECRRFLKDNFDVIKVSESFLNLPLDFAVNFIKTTFDLKTELDVLCYAHKNSINFIVKYLEPPYLEPLSLTNFCSIVRFAWGCSRKELKKACGKFFSENFEEILKMDEFTALPDNEMGGVLALGKAFMSRDS